MTPDDRTLPQVSVVVPVFNAPCGTRACLEALARQTYPSTRFEVLVVDNGSRPPLDLGEAFSGARLLLEPAPGSYSARNRGVRAARGEILAFTDADCVPDPDWIEAGVRSVSRLGTPGFVAGAVSLHAPPHRAPGWVERYEMRFALRQKDHLERELYAATANLWVRREVFEQVGPFLPFLKSGGDLEWGRRAHRLGFRGVYAPEVRVRHPARSTLGELLRKSARCAGGRFDLSRAGILPQRSSASRLSFAAARLREIWGASEGTPPAERARLSALFLLDRAAQAAEMARLRLGGCSRRS